MLEPPSISSRNSRTKQFLSVFAFSHYREIRSLIKLARILRVTLKFLKNPSTTIQRSSIIENSTVFVCAISRNGRDSTIVVVSVCLLPRIDILIFHEVRVPVVSHSLRDFTSKVLKQHFLELSDSFVSKKNLKPCENKLKVKATWRAGELLKIFKQRVNDA